MLPSSVAKIQREDTIREREREREKQTKKNKRGEITRNVRRKGGNNEARNVWPPHKTAPRGPPMGFLLLCCCFAAAFAAALLLCCCFAAASLLLPCFAAASLLCCCFAVALLLLCCCFAALLRPRLMTIPSRTRFPWCKWFCLVLEHFSTRKPPYQQNAATTRHIPIHARLP